jgi:aspartate-semialdehyde dehydrogenase
VNDLAKSRTSGWNGLYRVAIAGAASLRGRELKETLEEKNFPARDILLLDDEESSGQLDSVGDEATFVQSVTRTSFHNVDLVFFASDPAFTRRHWQFARDNGCAIVDLSGALDDDAAVEVRSPWLDRELKPEIQRSIVDLETTIVAAANPAATMLALLLHRAEKTGTVDHGVVTLFDPVSEHGKQGMDELHKQTLNLLSFQPMPREVFDVQVAFNLVAEYGDEAKVSMAATEERVLKHMRAISRSHVQMPALKLLQAPTFHGHAASIYLELRRKVKADELAVALRGEHVKVIGPSTMDAPLTADDQPSNVSAAGQQEIQVAVRADATRATGIWIWATADNLKISALTAVECGHGLLAGRPSGKIQ